MFEELRGLFTSLKKSECLDHLAKMGSVMKPSANLNCGLSYVWQNKNHNIEIFVG
jgi:hypothetical protein